MFATGALAYALLAGSALLGKPGAEAWPTLPAADGNSYSLADFRDSEVVVLVFTGNACPIAADYRERLNVMAERFESDAVRFLAINVGDGLGESLEDMKGLAESLKYIYLKDEGKILARRFNARVTPHAFVLEGPERRVVYEGAIDDCPTDPRAVTRPFLERAIRAALGGRGPVPRRTTPKGCSILY